MPPNKSSNVRYEDMPTRVMNVDTGGEEGQEREEIEEDRRR